MFILFRISEFELRIYYIRLRRHKFTVWLFIILIS